MNRHAYCIPWGRSDTHPPPLGRVSGGKSGGQRYRSTSVLGRTCPLGQVGGRRPRRGAEMRSRVARLIVGQLPIAPALTGQSEVGASDEWLWRIKVGKIYTSIG